MTSFASRWNLDAIEAAYQRWRDDPASVDASWRAFFEGFELGSARPAPPAAAAAKRQGDIVRLIQAYRTVGHQLARLDPLSDPPAALPALELKEFGFTDRDRNEPFDTSQFLGLPRATLGQLLTALKQTYCRTIGVEYMHIQDPAIRRWLQDRMEPARNQPSYPRRMKLRILMNLHFAEVFERFLQRRYVGQKRFSLEGAETLIPLLDHLVDRAADSGVREMVLGMSHRGRLNVLANILAKPYAEIFHEFEENYLPNSMDGDGDVKYHLGFSSDRTTPAGNPIHLSLSPNPSHLEAIDPVVEGRTRAKQQQWADDERSRGLPLLLHGDAAFAGQGLIAETLNLSKLPGYKTGGTIHVIINNQIGFTTSPSEARSTRYCTDVAKMIEAPIFHVNGEDPEATLWIAELALDFRQTFHQDVVIDMYCYRRHGHNEGDEPSFTQPLMYAKIQQRPGLSEIYTERLIMNGALTAEEREGITHQFDKKLEAAEEEVKTLKPQVTGMRGYQGRWKTLGAQYNPEPVETGVPLETLQKIAAGLTRTPENFHVHPKLARFHEERRKNMEERKPIDWAFAEALAFGSLLLEKIQVRLTGQDTRRGTFSQRHATLYDVETGKAYTPLQHLDPAQAPCYIYDSLLSEAAALGFEFGYSLDAPDALVLWEAQFGDFANGGQVIIDQFIVCSHSKWQRDSGLVMLLPHGYEGQGPEHSSARLERFLQMCGEDNIQVGYPTTPAQYFHVLRRQMHRSFRKPLVLMTPKSLLRHKQVVSPLGAFSGGRFHEVLDDPAADPQRVRRVILCSGKVYYDLLDKRNQEEQPVALVRVEQFYPFPVEALQAALKRYSKAREHLWVQEESLNMGGWTFMEPKLRALGLEPKYVGRDTSASPATGSRNIHLREQKELVETAIAGQAPHLVRSAPPAQLKRFAKLESESTGDGEVESEKAAR